MNDAGREGVMRSVLARLQYLLHRGRRRLDPDSCAFCGCGANVPGPLCGECTGLLERLAARFPKPAHTPPVPVLPVPEPPAREREWLPYVERDDC